jgi:opacity protein-like surface antigen
MKKVSVAVLGLLLGSSFPGANPASAADMPDVIPLSAPSWSWTGFYFGAHLGGGFANTQFSDARGPAIYGGTVRSPAFLGGGQGGYNWQIPNSNLVLGVEADISGSISDGSATCLASSGFFISANCRVHQGLGGSLTGRVGWAAGAQGRTLLYAKGGGAFLQERIDITSNPLIFPSTGFDGTRWGWTVGGGVERAITPAWSFKLEYDYANFGAINVATPESFIQVLPPLANGYLQTAGGVTSVSQNLQTVKVGLNYKIGVDGDAKFEPAASDYRLRGTTDAPVVPGIEIEIGGRIWYSSGRFQKDLGATSNQAQQNVLVSRLTYDTTAASGEVFGRIDTSQNVFLKGFVGGGKILSGNMHDEDWLIFGATVPYSNTLSTVSGDIGYATIDLGYSFFRGPSANVGGFVGYNYYREDKSAYGCVQIANRFSDCVPSIPNSTLGITENNKWNSFRVGVNGAVKVWDRLTLSAEAAYLPFVNFSGTDNHLLRTDVSNTVSPEQGAGHGVQLEAILSYAIGKSFSVGAGGRYWAMWAPGASTNIFGTDCPCQTLPVRTERYGGFLQASYKLDAIR